MPELLIFIPFAGAVISFILPGKIRSAAGLLSAFLVTVAALTAARQVYVFDVVRIDMGGWLQPLGIGLHADGLSVLFFILSSTVGLLVSIYSISYFSQKSESLNCKHFWPLWLLLWGGLNSLFLVSDIFNAYVVLELVTISAAALAALSGRSASLVAALRYFLAAMAGSIAFLLGVGLLYAQSGVLDMFIIAQAGHSTPLSATAFGLMTAGLIIKTALFPFHFWLPPAHGEAPSPVSAILSALVIKGSFYLLIRLWMTVFDQTSTPAAAAFIGMMGFAAILWGSYQAIVQDRLKLIVAYSSVGQVGYLFLVFPIVFAASDPSWKIEAWTACIFQAVSHGLAKAAMFLGAGNLILASGTDNIRLMRNIAKRLPMTTFTLALAGVSLMGLPPSGGFVAKWMLLQSILDSGQWWFAAAPVLGGLLTAAYIFKILSHAFVSDSEKQCCRRVPFIMEKTALLLALLSILIGFRAEEVVFLLEERMYFEAFGGPGP